MGKEERFDIFVQFPFSKQTKAICNTGFLWNLVQKKGPLCAVLQTKSYTWIWEACVKITIALKIMQVGPRAELLP